ncbi:MAG TPA: M20/M25/M40 family metallo-hydrolase [Pseudolabrys sp.]|nr:M20/M25/M40 family metallo-hydrolase [Pseudolabrys sp.]
MSHPDFAKAASYVTADLIRDLLIDLVDIPSPTGRELGVAQYLQQRMRQSGLDADLQFVDENRPNVVGHLRGRGTGANLLFTGHMDTSYSGEEAHLVGPGFKPKATMQDGWMWGLGANNMKSGLAAALVAIEAIMKAGITLDGDISFGGVVGEIEKAPVEEFQGIEYSGYGTGSKYMVTHGVTADYALLMEPTGLRICTANMGAIWLRIDVDGTVAHSAHADRPGTVNAIEVMHALLDDINKWAADYRARTTYMNEHANVTIACIRGGAPWRLSRNPTTCSLYLDIRTVPGQTVDIVKRELRAVLRGFAGRNKIPEPRLWVYVSDPATAIDDDVPVVQALGAGQAAVMGERTPSIIRRPGADAVHFTVYGVPCVIFGPGGRMHPDARGGAMHALGEHILIDDIVTASRIYLATALDLCNRKPPEAR